jgi:hypothetical protein
MKEMDSTNLGNSDDMILNMLENDLCSNAQVVSHQDNEFYDIEINNLELS